MSRPAKMLTLVVLCRRLPFRYTLQVPVRCLHAVMFAFECNRQQTSATTNASKLTTLVSVASLYGFVNRVYCA
jgi:hypothetical protein